jgi:hypothetical protein
MFSNCLRVYCLLWFYNIAQVSSAAPPVHVRTLLVGSLTGDQAIAEAVPALVVRVENLYETGGEYYTVDAGANWAGAPFELSVRDAPDRRPHYDVAGFVAHISDPGADARRRMRSGHYIAYVHCEGCWFELDDSKITALSEPPTRFPYLVFLMRTDGRRMLRGKQAPSGTPDVAMLTLLQQRAAACVAAASSSSGGPPASKRPRVRCRSDRDQSGRHQERSGQQQDRSGRVDERVKRQWGSHSAGDNRDHSRSDAYNNLDNPYKRYADNWEHGPRQTSQCASGLSGPSQCYLSHAASAPTLLSSGGRTSLHTSTPSTEACSATETLSSRCYPCSHTW